MNKPSNLSPIVSVIALCYNHERFVVECLDSIRDQTFSDIELVIIDDCSCDRSATVIEKWISTNRYMCKFIKHSQNRGICKSINEGLSCVTGKYVAIVASDDIWLPTKIEHQVSLMEQACEDVGVIFCNAFHMDEAGIIKGEIFPERCLELNLKQVPQGDVHATLWIGNFIPAVTALVRRSCYAKIGTYDESLFYEDYDMWLRISREYRFLYSPAIVAKYRNMPHSSAHSNTSKMDESKSRIFQKFLDDSTVNTALRKLIEKKFVEFQAARDFKQRSPRRNCTIWKAIRLVGGMKYYMMLLFSLAGFSFNHYIWTWLTLQRFANYRDKLRRKK
jgi:glycosyltransferase involved in cell wall biosynthesis